MSDLEFLRVDTANPEHRALFDELVLPYITEIESHNDRHPDNETLHKIANWIFGQIDVGERFFEVAFDGDEAIGFVFAAIDREGDEGFVKPGYGFVREFGVKAERRHNGYGGAIYAHAERILSERGVTRMYLTADPVTGRPFWEAMGFAATGEISPVNKLEIYEKDV